MSDLQQAITSFLEQQTSYYVIVGVDYVPSSKCRTMQDVFQRIQKAGAIVKVPLVARPTYKDGALHFAAMVQPTAMLKGSLIDNMSKITCASVILRYNGKQYVILDTIFETPHRKLPNTMPLLRLQLNIKDSK